MDTRRDGVGKNCFNGSDNGIKKDFMVRGSALWEPSDTFSLTTRGDYSEFYESGLACNGVSNIVTGDLL
jgi:hypothetical protein